MLTSYKIFVLKKQNFYEARRDLYLFNSSLHDDEEYINETKQIRKRMMSHISRTVTSIIISMRLDGSPKVYVKQDKFLGFINSIIR